MEVKFCGILVVLTAATRHTQNRHCYSNTVAYVVEYGIVM